MKEVNRENYDYASSDYQRGDDFSVGEELACGSVDERGTGEKCVSCRSYFVEPSKHQDHESPNNQSQGPWTGP